MRWQDAQIAAQAETPVYRTAWAMRGSLQVVRYYVHDGIVGYYVGNYACGSNYKIYEPTSEDETAKDWNVVK